MVRRTVRLNIHSAIQERNLCDGKYRSNRLDGIEHSVWNSERAYRVDEGETFEKKIPFRDFNILQAAHHSPMQTMQVVDEMAPDALGRVDDSIEGTAKVVSAVLAYLTMEVEDDGEYGMRYRYHLSRKIREHNPEMGDAFVAWTTKPDDSNGEDEVSEDVNSASEVTW